MSDYNTEFSLFGMNPRRYSVFMVHSDDCTRRRVEHRCPITEAVISLPSVNSHYVDVSEAAMPDPRSQSAPPSTPKTGAPEEDTKSITDEGGIEPLHQRNARTDSPTE